MASMITETKNLISLGNMCQTLQQTAPRLARRLEALGIRPIVLIDNVPFFDSGDAEIAALLSEPTQTPEAKGTT
jgi:hypothetical protein